MRRKCGSWKQWTTDLPTYLPIYLPTHLPTFLPTYLFAYLPNYLSTYLPFSSYLIPERSIRLMRSGSAAEVRQMEAVAGVCQWNHINVCVDFRLENG